MESRGILLLRPYLSLFIVVPESAAPRREELKRLVTEINTTQVDAEEVLSNHAYYYDRKKGKLLL